MTETQQVREAVAAFTTAEDLEAAIDELLSSGFSRAELSLLASTDTVRQKLGHSFSSTRDLEDDPNVPVTAYVARESVGDAEGGVIGGLMYVGAFLGLGPVLASGGTIGAAILAAVLGGGGGTALGAMLARLIGKSHAEQLAEQLERGGLLLWVRTRDTGHEERARKILSRHSGQDVHIHGVPDHRSDLQLHYAELPRENRILMETLVYHDTQIIKADDGHCFSMGRVFATEADAKRFIVEAESEV
jgi:hypothetical protein